MLQVSLNLKPLPHIGQDLLGIESQLTFVLSHTNELNSRKNTCKLLTNSKMIFFYALL